MGDVSLPPNEGTVPPAPTPTVPTPTAPNPAPPCRGAEAASALTPWIGGAHTGPALSAPGRLGR